MNRTDRLHAVHEALRRAGGNGLRADSLADRLEVSVRTIKRDISALQQAGAPIWARPGPGGGYVLDAEATLPPVALTPSQAVALAVAVAMLPPGSPFGLDATHAADRVLATLSDATRQRAATLAEQVWVLPGERVRPAPSGVVRSIEQALAEHRTLRVTYRDNSGNETRRTIEPVMAAWGNDRWYLVAHCQLRNDIRWFRMDRIAEAQMTRESYQPRPVSDVGTPPPTARSVDGETGARDREASPQLADGDKRAAQERQPQHG